MKNAMRAALGAAILLLLSAGAAQAAAIYTATDCTGEPTPCTTDLQHALDNTSYDTVVVLSGERFVGDYLIDRGLTLRGQTGSELEASTANGYALRIETTSWVTVETLLVDGRLAVYDSNDITLDTVTVTGDDIGLQVKDVSDLDITDSSFDASDRAVDVLDSVGLVVTTSDLTSGSYGIVQSSSRVSVTNTDVYGTDRAVVLQDGNNSTLPRITATNGDIGCNGTEEEAWVWDRSTRTYSGTTVTEEVTTTSDLVSLLGYVPWGGD